MSDGMVTSAPFTVAKGRVKSKTPAVVERKTSYERFPGTDTSSVAEIHATPMVIAWSVVAAVQPPNVGGVMSIPGVAESSWTFASTLPAASRARTTKKRARVASGRWVTLADVAPGAVTSVGL